MSAYVLVIAPRVPTIHTCRITVDINVCACACMHPGVQGYYGRTRSAEDQRAFSERLPVLDLFHGLALEHHHHLQANQTRRAPLSAHRASNLPSQTGHLPLSRERLSRACLAQQRLRRTTAEPECTRCAFIRTTYSERHATHIRAVSERQEPARAAL